MREIALRKHGEPWQFRVEVKKNMISVHEAGDLSGLDRLEAKCGRGPLSAAEKMKHASFMAVMRFVLVDISSRQRGGTVICTPHTRTSYLHTSCMCVSIYPW